MTDQFGGSDSVVQQRSDDFSQDRNEVPSKSPRLSNTSGHEEIHSRMKIAFDSLHKIMLSDGSSCPAAEVDDTMVFKLTDFMRSHFDECCMKSLNVKDVLGQMITWKAFDSEATDILGLRFLCALTMKFPLILKDLLEEKLSLWTGNSEQRSMVQHRTAPTVFKILLDSIKELELAERQSFVALLFRCDIVNTAYSFLLTPSSQIGNAVNLLVEVVVSSDDQAERLSIVRNVVNALSDNQCGEPEALWQVLLELTRHCPQLVQQASEHRVNVGWILQRWSKMELNEACCLVAEVFLLDKTDVTSAEVGSLFQMVKGHFPSTKANEYLLKILVNFWWRETRKLDDGCRDFLHEKFWTMIDQISGCVCGHSISNHNCSARSKGTACFRVLARFLQAIRKTPTAFSVEEGRRHLREVLARLDPLPALDIDDKSDLGSMLRVWSEHVEYQFDVGVGRYDRLYSDLASALIDRYGTDISHIRMVGHLVAGRSENAQLSMLRYSLASRVVDAFGDGGQLNVASHNSDESDDAMMASSTEDNPPPRAAGGAATCGTREEFASACECMWDGLPDLNLVLHSRLATADAAELIRLMLKLAVVTRNSVPLPNGTNSSWLDACHGHITEMAAASRRFVIDQELFDSAAAALAVLSVQAALNAVSAQDTLALLARSDSLLSTTSVLRELMDAWVLILRITRYGSSNNSRDAQMPINRDFIEEALPLILIRAVQHHDWESKRVACELISTTVSNFFAAPSSGQSSSSSTTGIMSLEGYSQKLQQLNKLGLLRATREMADEEDTWDYLADTIDTLQAVTGAQGLRQMASVRECPGGSLPQEVTDDLAWLFSLNTAVMRDEAVLAKDLYKSKPLLILDDLLRSLNGHVDMDCY